MDGHERKGSGRRGSEGVLVGKSRRRARVALSTRPEPAKAAELKLKPVSSLRMRTCRLFVYPAGFQSAPARAPWRGPKTVKLIKYLTLFIPVSEFYNFLILKIKIK
jgi:hypothetical protein